MNGIRDDELDQVLLGVEAGSAEEAIAEEVRQAFPAKQIRVIPCAPDRAVNPKISKLVQMELAARHDLWLLSDSEVMLDGPVLEALRREWRDGGGAVLTAGYRFTNLATWPQRCDAVAVLMGLWPGMAVVRRFKRVDFTLGACTLVRRTEVAEVGGWAAFGDFLAEDRQLGLALAAAGKKIRLSTQVVTLESDPMSWGDFWRHQRRVAVTYRVANPWGFAGMIFTHGSTLFVLLLVLSPSHHLAAAEALAAWLVRLLTIRLFDRWLAFRTPGFWPALLVMSVVEPLCWLLAWVWPRVQWAGKWWRVTRDGRLRLA